MFFGSLAISSLCVPLLPYLVLEDRIWEISEFRASVVYRASSWTVRAAQRNPVLEKKKRNPQGAWPSQSNYLHISVVLALELSLTEPAAEPSSGYVKKCRSYEVCGERLLRKDPKLGLLSSPVCIH